MKIKEINEEIRQAVINSFILKLEKIGTFLEGKIAEEIARIPIYDKGDFANKLTYNVRPTKSTITLKIFSESKHAKYVLGGKVPSWTPKAPLVSWVKRKISKSPSFARKFSTKSGELMPIDSIVYLIRSKIRREGIKERNVIQDTVKKYIDYVNNELRA